MRETAGKPAAAAARPRNRRRGSVIPAPSLRTRPPPSSAASRHSPENTRRKDQISVAPSESLNSGRRRSEHASKADQRQQSAMEKPTGERRVRKPRWLQKKRHLK